MDENPAEAMTSVSEQLEAGGKFDVILAMLLGIAAIAAAWAAYQSGMLGGDAQVKMNQSIKTSDEASQQYTEGNQQYAQDQAYFLEYVKAAQEENEDLVVYLKENLFDENLANAITWWEEQPDTDDSPATPFDDANEEYVIAGWDEGERLDAKAEKEFETGNDLDNRGDKFDLATVLLAVALFMFGIASVFRVRFVRYSAAITGVLILTIALIRVIDLGYYGGA